jgi:proline/glutamate/leucine-rich protein 1
MSVILSTAIFPLVSPRSGHASGAWPAFSRLTLPETRAVVDDDDDDEVDKEKDEDDDEDVIPTIETEPLPLEEDDYFDENDFDDDFDDDFEEEYEEIEADFNENDEEKLPEPPKIEEEPDLDGDF